MSLKKLFLSVVVNGLLICSSNLFAQTFQSVNLAWDASASPSVASYMVRYGTASGAYLYSTNVGNQTTVKVAGLLSGQTYFFAVTALDAGGLESPPSNEISYLVPVSTSPPAIALTSPLSGANYAAPASINCAASVTANGHTITKVQFYNGAILLGEDTLAPYSFTWGNVPAGSYSLTARAIYNVTNVVNSASASVLVTSPPASGGLTLAADSGTVTAPFVVSNGIVFQNMQTGLSDGGRAAYSFTLANAGDYTVSAMVDAPGEGANSLFVNIDAEPTDPYMIWQIPPTTGSQSRVVSWQGNGTWDNSEFAPKVFTLSAGTHQLIVRGREANTKFGTISISPVTNSTLPMVTLSAPVAGASYAAPATITCAASVTANGHTITKVQFYSGAILVGEDTTAPYNVTWSNVSAGSYSLTARVVYDAGSTLNSAPINVTVTATNPPPTIALTAPTSGATYAAPATIPCAATVTPNGHTITKVQFFNGPTLLGEDASAPYNYSWNGVSGGVYSLTARAVYDFGSAVDSAPVSLTVSALPAPWQSAEIGTVGLAGGASYSNGNYTVQGAGQIAGTADSFRFVYQPLSADGEIKARLSAISPDGPNRIVGVMIRESLAPGAKYAFMGIGQDLRFRWQRREKTSGSASSIISSTCTPPNAWVRVVRSGNMLVGYHSTDGLNWTKVSSRNIAMASNIQVGLVVASGDTSTVNTSAFTGVNVTP